MSSYLAKGVAVSAMALGLMAGQVYAQDNSNTEGENSEAAAPAAPTGSWVKLCNKDENLEKEVCVVSQELRDPNTAQLVASATIRLIEGEQKVLILAVPTGVLIPPGMRVQIDQAEPKKADYAICFPNACVARMLIDDAYISSLKNGGQLGIAVMGGDQQQVGFPLSLVGFTKAYDGDATPQAEYEQTQQQLADIIRQRAEAARAAQQEQAEGDGTNSDASE